MDRTGPILVAAALSGAAAAAPAADDVYVHTGRDLAASCAICHGTDGINAGGIPNLAAQPREYLAAQLRDFRDGRRGATIMHQIAKGLTEAQIEAVSDYWSRRTVR